MKGNEYLKYNEYDKAIACYQSALEDPSVDSFFKAMINTNLAFVALQQVFFITFYRNPFILLFVEEISTSSRFWCHSHSS